MASFYGKVEEVQRLIATRSYREATAILRGQLRNDATNVWLRQQLADVLVLSGQQDSALGVLDTLVDTFLEGGFHQKAIATVKRMQRLAPGDPANEVRLAAIVRSQEQELARSRPGSTTAASDAKVSQGVASGQEGFRAALRQPSQTRFARPDRAGDDAKDAPPQPAPADSRPVRAAPAAPPPPAAEEIVIEELDITPALAGPALGGLAHSPLFGQLSPDDLLATVRSLDLKICEPGEILVTEGEPGSSLYVLVAGSARVYVRAADGSSHLVRLLGEGELFGEISLLTGQRRTATVVTSTRCELLELDAAGVKALAVDHPQIPIVIREICESRAGSSEERAARGARPAR